MTDDKGDSIDIADSALCCVVGDSKALLEQAAAFQAAYQLYRERRPYELFGVGRTQSLAARDDARIDRLSETRDDIEGHVVAVDLSGHEGQIRIESLRR